MTNGDRIRKSNNEELGDILKKIGAGDVIEDIICKKCNHTTICDSTGLCVYRDEAFIPVWLEQEECNG